MCGVLCAEYGTPGMEAGMQPPAPRPPSRFAAEGPAQPAATAPAAAAVSASVESGGGLGSGLQTLLGMEATPMKHGGYLFTHQQSGTAGVTLGLRIPANGRIL